ncbi:MAG: hypothetical protein NTZ07_02535 [Candidatus Woesebacteria bacterium]|nr:hypothetical protein [Candidatus Woesebacteria bacterium]
MKILQKIIAASAMSAFLLAAPITVLAAVTKATPTPTASPVPTIEPTVAPAEVTPAPQSTTQWVMTHKKISLGILVVVGALGYVLFRPKKNNQSPPEEQSKPEEPKAEEEPKEEEQKPPEAEV